MKIKHDTYVFLIKTIFLYYSEVYPFYCKILPPSRSIFYTVLFVCRTSILMPKKWTFFFINSTLTIFIYLHKLISIIYTQSNYYYYFFILVVKIYKIIVQHSTYYIFFLKSVFKLVWKNLGKSVWKIILDRVLLFSCTKHIQWEDFKQNLLILNTN